MAVVAIASNPRRIESLGATVISHGGVSSPDASLHSGGEMLFKVAFVLLLLWLLGMGGLYRIGDFLHALLLVGLMLLMMAFIKARDAALRRAVDDTSAKR